MPVRAAVTREPREHQAQAVQQLGARAEGAADARNAGALVQRQRSGNIQHLVHIGLCGLRHAAARVGGERLQIAPGALRIQHAERERGFAGAGYPGDADDFVQRHVDIDIFQIVHPRAPDADLLRSVCFFSHKSTCKR